MPNPNAAPDPDPDPTWEDFTAMCAEQDKEKTALLNGLMASVRRAQRHLTTPFGTIAEMAPAHAGLEQVFKFLSSQLPSDEAEPVALAAILIASDEEESLTITTMFPEMQPPSGERESPA